MLMNIDLSATIDNDRKSWSTITATANELQDSFRREKLDYESIALYVEVIDFFFTLLFLFHSNECCDYIDEIH